MHSPLGLNASFLFVGVLQCCGLVMLQEDYPLAEGGKQKRDTYTQRLTTRCSVKAHLYWPWHMACCSPQTHPQLCDIGGCACTGRGTPGCGTWTSAG